MNIIVGCEESQAVTIELRKRGHNAFSCDLLPCSGGHPEWHFQCDIFDVISGGYLITQAGNHMIIKKWDMGIFFPTCTFITCSAEWAYKEGPYHQKVKPGTLVGAERVEARNAALCFVRDLMNANIERIAIENPVGVISSRIFWYCGGIGPDRWEVFPTPTRGGRKPDQVIQPWMFGDDASKATCLWLKGLPKLVSTRKRPAIKKFIRNGEVVEVDELVLEGCGGMITPIRENQTDSGQNRLSPGENRAMLRSKTYPGIAAAMAEQWTKEQNPVLSLF